MRLSPQERQTITGILRAVDPQGEFVLFGSRADDQRKGGDIDLWWRTSRRLDLKTQMTTQWRLEVACDTNVDLLVSGPREPESAIHQIARETGVAL